jgi:pilus assembly protein TadC
MTGQFAVGSAVGLLVATLTLLALPRARAEYDAATALGDRPVNKTDGRRQLGVGTPGARAPTSEEIAASMVLLSVALQSGSGVLEAIEQVAQVAPALPAAELAVVAAGLRWGLAEDQAWAQVDPRWSRTALALRMAREAGVPPSALLLTGADDLRSSRLAAIDVAAARLGVRLVIPLGVTFLPAFVLTTVVPVVLALARQVLAS